ncbi:MAG: transglycosylase domain-containing protein, partial [Candidatus Gastranaerophilales bacterium]|nr:transglycosylase domain-containing protein [Candidatus Gastranaerophilales bacterium]
MRKRRKKSGGCLSYIFVVFVSAFLAVIVAFNLYLASLKPISNFKDIKPNPVTSIYSSDGENIKTFTAYSFEKVSIDDIPKNLKNAIIATEDKNFYSHRGFDTLGLIRSLITNIKAGSVKQGASTITQQLARILFLSNERTFDRKIKELIIAHRIEKTISKDEILDMYLNSVYLGSGTYGVLSASKTYFDKSLNELTLAETALIAGLPQAPSIYSPFTNPDAAVKRRNQVLKRMYKTGYISKKQYENALDEPLKLNKKPRI